MYRTYPQKKALNHDKATSGDFVPDDTSTEYSQIGSKDRFPKRGLKSKQSHYDAKQGKKSYASGGGNAQRSRFFPQRGSHSAKFGTGAGSRDTIAKPTSVRPKVK